MRKRTVVTLSVVGGIWGFILVAASVLFCLFFSIKALEYDVVDKDISDTYEVQLDLLNPNRHSLKGEPPVYAPCLYKILNIDVLDTGNTWRELEFIDQVKIWTKNETSAYFLGENKPYIKLDLINNQEFIYEDLGDYPPEDQKIFQNLASHPEWFLEAQEVDTIYHANGGGEVPFYKVD